jgi:cyclophilin family peptidyl-prolyl cis-trans isomerase/HEAT repeat protein
MIACAATAVLLACPGHPPPQQPSQKSDEIALRLRVAQAEARRGDGLVELVELATHGAKPERLLALRGLGRIGGARALEVLAGVLGDPDPEILGTAATAIGLATSLDEPDAGTATLTKALVEAMPRAKQYEPDVIEAIGRAADASAQASLIARLDAASTAGDARVRTAIATAFGRYGRRKLELSRAARSAVVKLAANETLEPATRYAVAWALAREQLPKPSADRDPILDEAGVHLRRMLNDKVAEVRSQAASAIGRRKWEGARTLLVQATRDPDWRVGVEAVRALTGEGSIARSHADVLDLLDLNLKRLEAGDANQAQVVIEALRGLAPHPTLESVKSLDYLAKRVGESKTLPPVTRGWIECLAIVASTRAAATPDYAAVESCGHGGLPDHLRLPLLGELITAKVGPLTTRRAALGKLLAHGDARVRVAGMNALAALWKEGDAADHRAAIATLVAALGSNNPIIAGNAVDAATTIYELASTADGRDELDAAVIARARVEQEPELAAALFELIGKRVIATGAPACRAGLAGAPVLARAAANCLKALGAPPPPISIGPATPPPIDVTTVIGRSLRWHLMTTRGDLVIALDPDAAPWAVAAIVTLTRKGFYDGLEVHRVVGNFVVQGGDPTQSGWGGPGFTIPAEPSTGSGFVAGGVGIADSGRDSGGSQWFVMHSPAPHLDGRYTWIGKVESGQKSADALLIGDKVTRAVIEVVPDQPK